MNKYSPNHYQQGKIEVWDFISDQNLDYFLGNAIKYICRAGFKKGETRVDDLTKAIVYLTKALNLTSTSLNHANKDPRFIRTSSSISSS
tara:strand:+ start:105 stop:371 length:267 start_codon:yes stop_codon:yes gene_type:complete